MDEIDEQIMTVIKANSSSMSTSEVAQGIVDTYSVAYPYIRVRGRLDSLCKYHYLTFERKSFGKGRPTKVYSLERVL